jgi:hypothetical protein
VDTLQAEKLRDIIEFIHTAVGKPPFISYFGEQADSVKVTLEFWIPRETAKKKS